MNAHWILKTRCGSDSGRNFCSRLAVLCWLPLQLMACATVGLPADTPTGTASVESTTVAAPAPLPGAEGSPQAIEPIAAIQAGAAAPDNPAAALRSAETVAPAVLASSADEPVAAAPLTVVDPLQPDVRINPNDHSARIDLWERLRAGFGFSDLDTDLVRAQERWYSARPDYVQRMTERGGRYLFHILQELERRRLPTELALLPFIESAFNPEAMSSARASGMWQFMPSTGRNYALKQNVFRDDRRDVLASTRAALDYLEKLHGMFGDWHLALAAYNWGEGNVARAIARNRRLGKPADYASLKMPNETRHYVPKLQAVKNIVARPDLFGLVLPALANHPYFLSVPIERDIDVDLAARLAGLTVEDFRALNPQMNKPVILAAGTPQVLLPYDNANRFVQDLPLHRGQFASWTAWVAPKTLKPAEAAMQVGMAEDQLRQLNVIPERMLIKAGSTLLVPRNDQRHGDVSEHLADNAMIGLAPDGPQARRMSLRAGRRDSVTTIARRYGLMAEHVAHWNSVDVAAAFRPGQTVVVFMPNKGQRGRVAAPAAAGHKARPASAARSAGRSTTHLRLAKH